DAAQRADERERFAGRESACLRRPGARREGGVEEVDVEGDEHRPLADRLAYELAVGGGAELAELVRRQDGEAEVARDGDVLRAVERAAHSRLHRRTRLDQPFFDRALEGRAVEV